MGPATNKWLRRSLNQNGHNFPIVYHPQTSKYKYEEDGQIKADQGMTISKQSYLMIPTSQPVRPEKSSTTSDPASYRCCERCLLFCSSVKCFSCSQRCFFAEGVGAGRGVRVSSPLLLVPGGRSISSEHAGWELRISEGVGVAMLKLEPWAY